MQVSTTIESGPVILSFPSTMSESDYIDLKDWLDYVQKKIQRMVNYKKEDAA